MPGAKGKAVAAETLRSRFEDGRFSIDDTQMQTCDLHR